MWHGGPTLFLDLGKLNKLTPGRVRSFGARDSPSFKAHGLGTSLVVQWLRLHAPNAEGPGSMPGQGARDPTCHKKDQRSPMLQLRPGATKLINSFFKSSCLITLFSVLSTTLEQAEAGALESRGRPRRDQDGIHKVLKKHNQLSVREQRPGRDVHYYLTSLHLEASTSQKKLMSVQSLKSIHQRRFSSPFGCRRHFPCLPQRPVSQGVDSIPSVLHP